MTVSQTMTKFQEQTLSALKAEDDAVVAMVKPFVPMLEPFVGMVRMPFAEEFPTPREAVEQWFDFAIDVLRTRKDFTLKLINLFPAMGRPAVVKPASKAA